MTIRNDATVHGLDSLLSTLTGNASQQRCFVFCPHWPPNKCIYCTVVTFALTKQEKLASSGVTDSAWHVLCGRSCWCWLMQHCMGCIQFNLNKLQCQFQFHSNVASGKKWANHLKSCGSWYEYRRKFDRNATRLFLSLTGCISLNLQHAFPYKISCFLSTYMSTS